MRIAPVLLAASLASPALAEGDDLARVCALAQEQNARALDFVEKSYDFIIAQDATDDRREALMGLNATMDAMTAEYLELSLVCAGMGRFVATAQE